MNLNFHGIGESTADLNDRIVCGHIPGGVTMFLKIEYDPIIHPLRLNVDWAIGIELIIMRKKSISLMCICHMKNQNMKVTSLEFLLW